MSMSKFGRRPLLAVALSLLTAVPAFADVRIYSSPGGNVATYLAFFSEVKRSGERVIIDGPCYSACTLVLSTVPRNRVCVTRRAVLGFHAPEVVDKNGHTFHSREVTQAMAASYPPSVRTWIRRHGGLRSNFILLRGRELTALYRRC
jgi:hypothetical protein